MSILCATACKGRTPDTPSCEHQTLKQRILGKPLETEEILDLAIQIANGLDAGHADEVTGWQARLDNRGYCPGPHAGCGFLAHSHLAARKAD